MIGILLFIIYIVNIQFSHETYWRTYLPHCVFLLSLYSCGRLAGTIYMGFSCFLQGGTVLDVKLMNFCMLGKCSTAEIISAEYSWVYFWSDYSVPLICVSGFILTLYCFNYYSVEMHSEIRKYGASSIILSHVCITEFRAFCGSK
jgi:hypothetical protein